MNLLIIKIAIFYSNLDNFINFILVVFYSFINFIFKYLGLSFSIKNCYYLSYIINIIILSLYLFTSSNLSLVILEIL